MAKHLGTLFFETAQAPLERAGELFDAHKVDEALALLSPESLQGSIDEAATLVAKAAGVTVAGVKGMLPQNDMKHVLEQLAACHNNAATQWEAHTGHLGGLMDGVANLTSDGRAPDPGTCLFRLSEKMKLDKLLAAPLSDLGAAVDNWQIVVSESRRRLEAGDALASAYRRRRKLRMAALVAVASVLVLAVGFGFRVMAARSAVQTVLDQADPCAVETIDEGDASRASSAQVSSLAEKRAACEVQREVAAKEKERVALAEAERKAKEAKRKQEAVWCVALKSAFDNPTSALSEDAIKVIGDYREMLERARARQLIVDDVSSDLKGLPCRDTPAESIIDLQLAIGYIASAGVWVGIKTPSAAVTKLLDEQSPKMPPRSRSFFQWRVEKYAGDAVNAGEPEGVTQAKALCDLVRKLDLVDGPNCKGASIL